MLTKIMIVGVDIPCTVLDLHKIKEHDYMYKS
jgi:hypothetical protein